MKKLFITLAGWLVAANALAQVTLSKTDEEPREKVQAGLRIEVARRIELGEQPQEPGRDR